MRSPEFWHAPPGPMAGLVTGLLAPLGTAWEVAGRLRRAVARPYRAPVAVICVGNLVAGGSGKTPVVLSLAGVSAAMGVAVHIVTRGYGGRLAGSVRVDPTRHDAAAVGDEALLIAARAPCWVARDRAAGVRAAVAAGAEAIVLDDGLQNPWVEKDLALVVIDADYGFGNRRVIPAGPLRESVAGGLARADAVVLLGDGAAPAELREAGRPIFRASLEPVRGETLAGARLIAFAGIGRPEKFVASLRRVGAVVIAAHPFPDHHRFSEAEIAGLRREAERVGARLVTTAKDWVRLSAPMRDGILVLEVEIKWRDRAAVTHVLCQLLRQAPGAHDHADHGPGCGYDRSAARG
jgi:tetraacyldisaccharide 4'-kinase